VGIRIVFNAQETMAVRCAKTMAENFLPANVRLDLIAPVFPFVRIGIVNHVARTVIARAVLEEIALATE